MLNSTEHEIYTLFALSLSDDVFIMLINVKMPTNVGAGLISCPAKLSMEKVLYPSRGMVILISCLGILQGHPLSLL